MCRIPKVIIVAPSERHTELRKALGSLEYDIAATVETADEAAGIGGDVAVAWEPDAATITALRDADKKTVAVGGDTDGADMAIDPDDVRSFTSRIWELFRP